VEASKTAEFAHSLPVQDRFAGALPRDNYRAVPDDWCVAVTDVVQSREAIEAGRYKAVNMAGVSMISAIMNAVGHQDMLYIFGGDGAAVAFHEEDAEVVRDAMAATVCWVAQDLELELRAAIVPVAAIRQTDADVLVAAVKVSAAIKNYAFIGGGIAWAEKAMKEGHYRIETAEPGARPDLTGLSCRWTPVEERGQKIVSLIIEPAEGEHDIAIEVLGDILEFVRADTADASPMPENGPGFRWPPEGIPYEAKASGMSRALLYAITLLAWVLDKTGWPMGSFDPKRYRKFTALNTDYRKIQDGVRMTIGMPEASVVGLREKLAGYREDGKLRFGICEQDRAVLTCFVPSISSDNHFHFLDGAGGGYAAAADNLS